jgi:hypothetical protein
VTLQDGCELTHVAVRNSDCGQTAILTARRAADDRNLTDDETHNALPDHGFSSCLSNDRDSLAADHMFHAADGCSRWLGCNAKPPDSRPFIGSRVEILPERPDYLSPASR